MPYLYNLGLLFRSIAQAQGDRPAIVFPSAPAISFAALDRLSDQIAAYLLRHGVQGSVLAIESHKSAYAYATLLAALKIGSPYTHLDTHNPRERLEKIFSTAEPALVIGDSAPSPLIQELCHAKALPCLRLDEPAVREAIAAEPPQLPWGVLREVTGSCPAYIMFTSGSTGTPKGVLIRQESVLNFIGWCEETFRIAPSDRLTNVNPIYFDNSVFDFYASLFNGASLAAFPPELLAHPELLPGAVEAMGCTFWFSVPSLLIYLQNLKLLTPSTFSGLRAIAFGGEGYPKEALKKLYDLYGAHASFFNVYGPTEGTCMCSALELGPKDFADLKGLPSLGYIAPNFSYMLLDEQGQPASRGELYLLGPQLALGYYNDPVRSTQAFVQNPLQHRFAEMAYRTGDSLELGPDGRLYFLGRLDNQVKHMGYRIELEEIEHALMALPYMAQCAVVHGKSIHGLSHLAAFLVAPERPGTDSERSAQVRRELREHLPDYMLPTDLHFLEVLPKNANGKVDRLKLKEMAGLG